MKGVKLKLLNTFAVDVQADCVITVHSENELRMFWQKANKKNKPILLLGAGSNVLFLEDYNGIILLNRIKGIIVSEDNKAWYLHVGAGEVWHDLVIYSLKRKMPGLENLALIPGYVGSAPIQNIGAYGVEFQQICEYVDILQMDIEKKVRLNINECQFSYRESIFKHKLRNNCIIVAVGLRLYKSWKPALNYKFLTKLNTKNVTPFQIFNLICNLRRDKIPDPSIIGNAGSFFKNPILKIKTAKKLLDLYPDAPYYIQLNGKIKLSAGWLIDCCQLKGYQLGQAAVHYKQALILINRGRATGREIFALANYVRQQVAEKFTILLEPEVRFIAAQGEIDITEAFL